MIREYTVNLPMPRIMVQPEELPVLTSGPFGGYPLIFSYSRPKRNTGKDLQKEPGLSFIIAREERKKKEVTAKEDQSRRSCIKNWSSLASTS